MSSSIAPNVRGVGTPGRRTVYSMCGMCAVRCPIEVTVKETIETFGGRGIAVSDRYGPFIDLTKAFVYALGSPKYFNHDASCGGNVHNAARSLFGFSHLGLVNDLKNTKHLVLNGLCPARPGDHPAYRQSPGLVDLPGDPAPNGQKGSARGARHRR